MTLRTGFYGLVEPHIAFFFFKKPPFKNSNNGAFIDLPCGTLSAFACSCWLPSNNLQDHLFSSTVCNDYIYYAKLKVFCDSAKSIRIEGL